MKGFWRLVALRLNGNGANKIAPLVGSGKLVAQPPESTLSALLVDIELSRRVAACIEAEPHVCWLNAYRAVRRLPATMPELSGAVYVEGFIVATWACVEPLEHAWIEARDAQGADVIVEPTLCLFDWWTGADFKYFAGARWQRYSLGEPTAFPYVVQLHGPRVEAGYPHTGYEAARRLAYAQTGIDERVFAACAALMHR